MSTKISRNSLIELYRFLFAFWVVYFHNYFIYPNKWFSNGFIAVDFFFILSGLFFYKDLLQYTSETPIKNLFKLILKRLKALGLPFIVGIIFAFWYCALTIPSNYKLSINVISFFNFGHLWYVFYMFIAFVFLYFVFLIIKITKLTTIKKQTLFYCLLIIFTIICYTIYFLNLKGAIYCRAIGGISFGLLISKIPKINNIRYKKLVICLIAISILFTIITCALPKPTNINQILLVSILFPCLLYFTTCISFNNNILKFLGSLSFPLYAYQCVLRVLHFYGVTTPILLFTILITLVLLNNLITYIIKSKKHSILTKTT